MEVYVVTRELEITAPQFSSSGIPHFNPVNDITPAEPGALSCEPLETAKLIFRPAQFPYALFAGDLESKIA